MTYELADLPMFRELGDRLEPLARRRRYPAGQVLCTEGDPAGQLIVLLAGRVRASRAGVDGREVVLSVESAPVAFDKTALLLDGPHRATLTALTPVEVCYLPAGAVLEAVAAEPAVASRLLRTLATTVRELDERLTDVVVLDVPGRVAKWLLRRAADGPVRLDDGQSGLGAEIGATRVSVNRALRSFARRGLIETRDGEIRLLDRGALARISGLPH
ncbi:Crp/Fnr family transcriptional regulator [Nonomuraea pusilla]|uniref:cAMP-binding domain of CRP or a regulatory subunit of cAMP-dependent protein kinases n=1 Tax=Nonomuraea pusilla TaxID=46177 RepID=A0A1H8J5R6_9ACTN|nr:Crp/Fnr family transcriptional regulator [Nonomuraea pusilla]SEN76082.1 cAMP-binding domain of CRP or a regulatory subunit of cAMP-dependent protein kinases [Nonomuraea pusilla]